MKYTLLGSLLALMAPLYVHAQDDAKPSHEYYVISASLTDLLSRVGREANVAIELDTDKSVYVTSLTLQGTGQEIMSQLADKYDLSFFTFNGKVYVGAHEDQQSRIIQNEHYSRDEMLLAVEQSGLELGQFSVNEIANPNAFILTGPPRLIAIAETIVTSLPPKETSKTDKIVVRRGVNISQLPAE